MPVCSPRRATLRLTSASVAVAVGLAGCSSLGGPSHGSTARGATTDPTGDAPSAAGPTAGDSVAPEPLEAIGQVVREHAEAVASYTLTARLDARTHQIHGEGTLSWQNTLVPVRELYFHLYHNAFANAQTLFERSPFRRARGGALPRTWGGIRLERLVVREFANRDLLSDLETHTPDDPLDETDLRLPLPRFVEPGEHLTIDLAWTSTLPDLTERTGFKDDFHFAGQWFPKLARLEKPRHWAHFPFDPESEFYADFGSYDVTLDVPAEMVVGATGHEISEVRNGERKLLRYHADDVHDFAWTAWPKFQRRDERIEHVDVHLLYPPGYELAADRTLAVLRRAFPHFESRYGNYPYPDLTVVHPPELAGNAGGMEYPTLITTGGAWHSPYWSRAVENVTVHEFGHQWFYGLLASNEHRWPFLDEGLNSYAESVAMKEFFGEGTGSDQLGITVSTNALYRFLMLDSPHDLPLGSSAADFPSFRTLGGVVYARTALLFQTLANVYGAPKLTHALHQYALNQRFQHPTPEDLLWALEEALGKAAANNARAAILSGAVVDYEVSELDTALLPKAPNEKGSVVESRVVVNRHGELSFPVDLLLVTATGQKLWRHWDGAERFKVFTERGTDPVVCAVIDPETRIALDENLLDNARRLRPEPALGTLERALYGAQLLIGALQP